MSGLLSKVGGLALLLLFAAAAFVVAFFYFYRGSYQAPPTVALPVDQLGAPQSSLRALEELPLIQKGTLVVDGIHGNQFLETELSSLLDRVADRGYEVDVVGLARRGGGFGSYDQDDRLELMEEKLRNADSLLVVAPATPYTQAEGDMVERYILSKGGKLLLVGDPTRSHNINSLADRFGIKYRQDYLYNLTDYDLNFQNIFMRSFREDDVTEGLEQVVFLHLKFGHRSDPRVGNGRSGYPLLLGGTAAPVQHHGQGWRRPGAGVDRPYIHGPPQKLDSGQ